MPILVINQLKDIRGFKLSSDGESSARQEDAHEFLLLLLEKINDELKIKAGANAELSTVDEILQIECDSTVMCFECKAESTTSEIIKDLSLDISRSNDIDGALANHFASEKVDYYCTICEKNGEAKIQRKICKSPAMLCIQLQRFHAG